MKPGRQHLLLIPPVGLLLGIAAGWLAPASVGTSDGRTHWPAAPAPGTDARETDASGTTSTLLKFERQLVESLDAESIPCSGERLKFLCLHRTRNEVSVYAQRWARQNPAGMFEWFQSRGAGLRLPTGNGDCEWFEEILFPAWAKTDPDAALGAALGLPNRHLRSRAFFCVLNELRETDLSRAESLLIEHADLFDLEWSPGVLENSRFGFEASFAFIQNLPPGDLRSKLLAGCFDNPELSKEREFWNAATDELRRELIAGGYWPQQFGEIFDPFAPTKLANGFDGIEAFLREKAETTGNLEHAAEFLKLCGGDWAKRDLAGAFEWAQTHLRGPQKVEKAAELFETAAGADFDATRAFWETLPPSTQRAWAVRHLAKGTPPHRRDEARALIESLPPGEVVRIRQRADPFADLSADLFGDPGAAPSRPFKAGAD